MTTRRRSPNRTRAMRDRGEFWVVMCSGCHHPGGLHVAYPPEKAGCRCCASCPGYEDGEFGVWSDARTDAMTEAPAIPAEGTTP